MTMFVIQAFLLIAIAFVLGAIVGALLRQITAGKEPVQPSSAEKTAPVPPKTTPPKPQVKSRPVPRPKAGKAVSSAAEKPAPEGKKDNLKRVDGIGPKNEKALNALGVYTFKQISAWSPAEQAEMGERMAFPGRIEREEWVKQAKALAEGRTPAAKPPQTRRPSKDGPTKTTGQITTDTKGSRPPVLAKPPAGGGDNLALVEGIGQALEKKLNAIGIYTLAQIAGWNASEQAWIGNELGFPRRPEREDWVNKAARLMKEGTSKAETAPARGEITAKRKTVIR